MLISSKNSYRFTLLWLCLSYFALACESFEYFCTTDSHCLPSQVCTPAGECEFIIDQTDLSSESTISKADQDEPQLDMTIDMEVDQDLDPPDMMDYEANTDPFTPPLPTCSVLNDQTRESAVLEMSNLGIAPRLLCVKEILIMVAPVNPDIKEMEKCVGIDSLQAGMQAGAEGGMQAGAEGGMQAGAEGGMQAGAEGGMQAEAGIEEGLAIYQYGRLEGDPTPKWYRRFNDETFDLNSEISLIYNDFEDEVECNKGYLYINEKPLDTSSPPFRVSLARSIFKKDYEWLSDRDLNYQVYPKNNKIHLVQKQLDDDSKRVEISIQELSEESGIDPDVLNRCETEFNLASSPVLQTWNARLTKSGFAWMQTHPIYDKHFAELHLVHRDSINRNIENRLCNQSIINIFDLRSKAPDELWQIPLKFDHDDLLYFCRYSSNGICSLHATQVASNGSQTKPVQIGTRPDTSSDYEYDVLNLPTNQFAVFKNHFLMVTYTEDRTRFYLKRATFIESIDRSELKIEFGDSIATGLRFPDFNLFLEKPDGDRLNVYWIHGQPNGWMVKSLNIDYNEDTTGP